MSAPTSPAAGTPSAGGRAGPDDVVIVGAARTPQGKLKGQLAALTGVELGSVAIRGRPDASCSARPGGAS
ncbi:hypothetical protein [Georgenia sp. SUBG003]|uniref:hypothetical protein n=1 Tax=Georgenia sp. SUBG003 TaxID=1497974 RepID=UPI003AB4D373